MEVIASLPNVGQNPIETGLSRFATSAVCIWVRPLCGCGHRVKAELQQITGESDAHGRVASLAAVVDDPLPGRA